MGKRAVRDAEVIDETFAGLVSPAEVHSIGRPDLTTDRPGDVLVDEVRRFEAEGGFKEIARARAEERRKEEEADAAAKPRQNLPDFGIKIQSSDAHIADAGLGTSDEK